MLPESQHSEFRRLLDSLLDEQLDEAGYARLAQLLAGNEEYQWLYITEMNLHGAMAWGWSGEHATDLLADQEGCIAAASQSGLDAGGACGGIPDQSPVIVIDTSGPFGPSVTNSSLLGYLSQVGPFSYLVSAVIMCVAALAAWQYKLAERGDLAVVLPRESVRSDDPMGEAPQKPASGWVASITQMADCQWAQTPVSKSGRRPASGVDLSVSSGVAAGRQLWLGSGLLEITYKTGAVVLLQGPATFEVDSNGGFLSLGRLTGKLDKGVVVSDPQAVALGPFTIATSAGTVADLGTEFGVEVNAEGQMISHVFRGSVVVRPAASSSSDDDGTELVLKEDESAQVDVSRGQAGSVRRIHYDPRHFVRQFAKNARKRVEVFGTGLEHQGWSEDARWQVVAISTIPDFRLQAANRIGPVRNWQVNGSGQAQWISTHAVPPDDLPVGALCTFRTSFDLADQNPESIVVNGWFLTNGHVDAIRLNGQSVSVPQHDERACSLFQRFSLEHGFCKGVNTIEFDARKIGRSPSVAGYSPYVGICVDLEGAVREK